MARMSREFSLVLLGAGLLTAGYFLMPEEDPIKLANDQATGGDGGGSRGRARVGHVFFFYSSGTSRAFASSSRASPATSRGGFGRIGAGMSGG